MKLQKVEACKNSYSYKRKPYELHTKFVLGVKEKKSPKG
jgi:hypothetical protein